MTWLNSHQAVEDIAYFLKMQSEYAVADGKKKAKKDVKSDELKWVLFSHSSERLSDNLIICLPAISLKLFFGLLLFIRAGNFMISYLSPEA